MSLIPLPPTLIPFLQPFLPVEKEQAVHVTLTWAQSLDARIASEKGAQTKISHPETKTMTHYIRAYHDAILVGIGTVLADDPKLNCRYGNMSKIRPVVIDPKGKWDYSASTLSRICAAGEGVAPYIFIGSDVEPSQENLQLLALQDGAYYRRDLSENPQENWDAIFATLHHEGIKSVMVEGGAKVINSLLTTNLVDSLILTIGPVFLGSNGVEVSPVTKVPLEDVVWWQGTSDTVMAARISKPDAPVPE